MTLGMTWAPTRAHPKPDAGWASVLRSDVSHGVRQWTDPIRSKMGVRDHAAATQTAAGSATPAVSPPGDRT